MQELSHLALNEEGFAFDPTTGDSFRINHTGLFILKKLREGIDENEIAEALTEEYEVSPDDAERDVTDFLRMLKTLNLSQE